MSLIADISMPKSTNLIICFLDLRGTGIFLQPKNIIRVFEGSMTGRRMERALMTAE